MKTRFAFALTTALTTVVGGGLVVAMQAGAARTTSQSRPQGPCDIYAAAGDPCVAAHSTTRALYARYNGPLYQVLRQSDGRTLDIGVVASAGYANAAAQDAFCANTFCFVSKIYDQSDRHNDLTQAPRGGFSGPAMGGFNTLPIADMAPVTVMGHKVYGVFIEPGMGLRNDDPKGTAVDDQAEGQYWVINGQHFNNGCCFDYGNAETDSRDDGNGTMETTYYGNSTGWYHGPGAGPWIMTDQENNLVGCVNADPRDKSCDLPTIDWRFVTAMAKGEPHHWTSMGGNAQQGALKVMFDGPRIDKSYDPMRKQGAILLGNGGDNSVGSQGTFYEGAMTAANTFPTDATDQLIQANVVAAKYGAARVSLSIGASTREDRPSTFQTFSPGSSKDVTVTFTNTTGATVTGLALALAVPAQWKSVATINSSFSPVAPGESVGATFTVTSGPVKWNGDLVGTARWTTSPGVRTSESTVARVRNVSPVTINEFQIASGAPANPTNSFIELYNAGKTAVDISGWTLTEHASLLPAFSSLKIPAATTLAPGGFYLLGLSTSGLTARAHIGDKTINVRSTTGMSVGDSINIDGETRTIASVGTPAANSTTLWQPLPDGPVMTVPVGSTNVPVTSIAGFVVGEKIALGYGASYPVVGRTLEKYEVATVTAVGKPGTQGRLSAAAPTGTSTLKVGNVDNISVGDKIRLDIDSVGHGIEWVTVTAVGTAGANGSGLTIAEKLKFDHASNMPFSDRGTGISFSPATAFAHSSNEPVQALGSGITLDKPFIREHAIDAVVQDPKVTTAGYQYVAKTAAYMGPAPGPDISTFNAGVPKQWFGGPAFSNAGSMILRDAAGLVVDSLNYGLLVDPWAAEGYQATSGSGQGGCRAPVPNVGRAGGPGVNRSAGRFPDGADADSNCTDFLSQIVTTMPAASGVGTTNIKVASVADFAEGQAVIVDAGANAETAMIATVGTPGATLMGDDTAVGATVITVASIAGFSAGQAITIGSGADLENALVASAAPGRPAGGGRGGAPVTAAVPATITVTAPLKSAHSVASQVSGSGITLTAPLKKTHAIGATVAVNAPTPGAANHYIKR